MTVWRPPAEIRVKALGLPRRGDSLLVAEIHADDGRLTGVRPLGGSVAFGERAEDALIREFEEELGITVTVLGGPRVVENIFLHEGQVGHEVLFLFPVALPPGRFDGQERFVFHEDCGTACVARWCDLDGLDVPGGPELFPTGLKAWLRAAWDAEP
ncbi:NUDIX domain-containing protein [Methylobacterium sp. 092160098-2]|uniref:NUDIX hydrolase n=1 Tax=Methylobacterium sp. 1973 TaxID=3156421 RepID=UPI002381B7FD|nr:MULTISPECIES: NUDIX domain-containing protein [Methylobacterium]MDE4915659.1 NUDIX domain-containing protein [Methylobacterium sp. 092160098-2]MDH3029539.1 NUDIX domain-containing protein [Methylobacterium fujisawaense]